MILQFFFQAEDGIRDSVESRGLGDVYERQGASRLKVLQVLLIKGATGASRLKVLKVVSYTHLTLLTKA